MDDKAYTCQRVNENEYIFMPSDVRIRETYRCAKASLQTLVCTFDGRARRLTNAQDIIEFAARGVSKSYVL